MIVTSLLKSIGSRRTLVTFLFIGSGWRWVFRFVFSSTYKLLPYFQGSCLKCVLYRRQWASETVWMLWWWRKIRNSDENLTQALRRLNISFTKNHFYNLLCIYFCQARFSEDWRDFRFSKSLAVARDRRAVVTVGSLSNIVVQKINCIVKSL
jgi:hypothetical protein